HIIDSGFMAREVADHLPGRYVPELRLRIKAPRGEPLAVPTDRHADSATCVSLEGAYHLAIGDVPQLNRAISAGRGKPPAIWTERYVQNISLVPIECVDDLPGRRVPHPERSRPTPARRGEPFAVRAEHHRVTLKRACLRITPRVPDLDRPIRAGGSELHS